MSTPGYRIPRKQQERESREADIPSTSSPLAKAIGTARKPQSPNVVPKPPVQPRPTSAERPKKAEERRKPPYSNPRVHVQRPVDPKLKQQQTLGKRPNGNQNACSPANKRPFREPCRDSVELLDRIWKEMDEDDRRKQSEEEQAEISSPNGSPSGPHIPTPTPTQQTLKLTRVELGNASRDDSLMRRFMDKPGLMERILGYKMLHARVVPYEMMRYPAKLDECEHPDSSDVDYGVKLEVEVLPPPSTSKVQLQTAPPIRLPARGPKTPPGSPQHDPDDGGSAEEWGLKSGPESPVHAKAEKPVEPLQTISPLPPPPPPVIIERDSQEEILHTVSQATNTPIDQVKAIIGEELHNAIGRVDRSVLLCTLKDAIRRVTKAPQATDSPALTGACDMEDSSTDSNASADQKSNSPLLLPPPPAPPAPPPAASIGEFQPPPRSIGMPPMHQSHFQAAPQRWEPPQPMFARESHVFVPPFSVVQPPAQPLGPPQFAAPQFIRHPPPRPLIDMSRPPPPPPPQRADFYAPHPYLVHQPIPQPIPQQMPQQMAPSYGHPMQQPLRFHNPQYPLYAPQPLNPSSMPPPPMFAGSQPEHNVFKTLINALGTPTNQPPPRPAPYSAFQMNPPPSSHFR